MMMGSCRLWRAAAVMMSMACVLLRCHLGLSDQPVSTSVKSTGKTRPNIVLIMADDMGFADIGCYGGEVQTPALDKLAQGGLRFTQFYNTGRCCPTRASLMTGLYPHQTGVGWMMSDNGHPGYRGDLNKNCATIAEVLRDAGYGTYMSGKWHITRHTQPMGPKHNWPRQRGFDRFYGTITGAGSFYDPATLTRDNTAIVPDEPNYYYTDAISNNAIKFIGEHQTNRPEDPFFLYVAYTSPHWPMHALPEDIARYKGRYDSGWDAIRSERYLRMLKLGVIKKEWGLTDRDKSVPAWRDEKMKAWHIRRMEVYAAMIDRMDQGIGRIVNKLKTENVFDKTLMLFLADNGGCAEEFGSSGPIKPDFEQGAKIPSMKPGELQGAMRPPITRDGRPIKVGAGLFPGPADTYIAYGKPWANVSNTPFRFYKHWVHEGGISSPLIVHWPQGVNRQGEWETQPGHLIDIMATCVDVSEANYPKQRNGQDIQPMEGLSLRPAFAGKNLDRKAIYWEHEGNRAVRVGDWKLVAAGENGPWELYDLEKDRTERIDLSAKHPGRVAEMKQLWEEYAKRAQVYPLRPYARRKTTSFSKKKRFQLKSGDDLSQNDAPMLRNRPFTLKATVKQRRGDGVIVAQGGDAHGFALYIKKDRLQFALVRDGKQQVVGGKTDLAETFVVELRVRPTGEVQATLNGKLDLEGKVDGLLRQMPIDGLQVGEDAGGTVGDYSGSNSLKADIQVDLRLEKANK